MLGSGELLAAWEAGRTVASTPGGRAQLLHALARPDADLEELRSVAVGAREGDLFGLRQRLFGDRMPVRLTCTGCEAELEFEIALADLFAGIDSDDGARSADPAGPAERTLSVGEWSVVFRTPVADDLAAAAGAGGPEAARQLLVERVVLRATCAGAPVAAAALPAAVVFELGQRIEAIDPAVDIGFAANCPECALVFRARFDIADCLWAELDAWAQNLLTDVHLLAQTYGWTEAEVLALSPLRRRFYLEAAGHV